MEPQNLLPPPTIYNLKDPEADQSVYPNPDEQKVDILHTIPSEIPPEALAGFMGKNMLFKKAMHQTFQPGYLDDEDLEGGFSQDHVGAPEASYYKHSDYKKSTLSISPFPDIFSKVVAIKPISDLSSEVIFTKTFEYAGLLKGLEITSPIQKPVGYELWQSDIQPEIDWSLPETTKSDVPGTDHQTGKMRLEVEQPEKISKARKLGRFIGKSSVRIARVLDKAVQHMSGASLLSPGTAMYYDNRSFDDEVKPEYKYKAKPDIDKDVIPGEPVIEAFERMGYVKQAPHFRDQVHDKTRTNKFKFRTAKPTNINSIYEPEIEVELTEHAGLVGLEKFLKNFVNKTGNRKNSQSLRSTAVSMLERLTFIGAKEYAEAAKGIGEYWRAYLDQDPARQICVLTRISQNNGMRKSDSFLLESILGTFSDEELEQYSGRVVTELEDISSMPDYVKVVLLDDWTISGAQMRNAYHSVKRSTKFGIFAEKVEINLLAASRARIKQGLSLNYATYGFSATIPVRAYFMAHDALAARSGYDEHSAHITGTHSSVDYDFENDIGSMRNRINEIQEYSNRNSKKIGMPPLTRITRHYRYAEPIIEVQGDGKIVRKKRVK